jgi:hypothetical protein
MKNGVIWGVMPCGPCENRGFGGTLTLFLVVTLMMEALRSFDTSVLTGDTWRNIPEDAIPISHCRENLKSYIALTGWTL